MKRLLILLATVALFIPQLASAQSELTPGQLQSAFKEDPFRYGGNHHNYPFSEYDVAPAPKGYEVVYLSHYGRHGSRYITNSAKYDTVADLLRSGHEKGALTQEGERLYNDYMAIYPFLEDHKGDLTLKGQEQHREIARRMIKAYPALFRKGSAVDARASLSHRAIISMMSFCDELHLQRPKLKISYAANQSDLSVTALNPPKGDDAAATKEFLKLFRAKAAGAGLVDALQDIGLDSEAFFLRYFKDMDTVREAGDPDTLFGNLAEIAFNLQCVDFPADLSGYFTEQEAFQSWENSNLYAVMMFIDTPFSGGFTTSRAYTLLDDILRLADSDLSGGEIKVRLRFGHDTVVGPLMALMGVEGFEAVGSDISRWKYEFQSWTIPMASNAQLVFYRNKRNHDDILVRLMYNEKDQLLPLPDQSLAPYYKWNDFKAYYTRVADEARELCEGVRSGNPVVRVDGGKLQGVVDGDVLIYKGVPFAAPPVGELRGKPLQPVHPWEGVLKADKFPAAAMQKPFSPDDPLYYREFYAEGDPEFSEDCMYLNIWAPADAVGDSGAKAPVAVWIHGGAFNHGYSFEKEMDGVEWAKRGVILVTIPYRVGELGYGTPEQLGFKDQVAALRWVRDNIASFGGDPSNVTLFGQSAGAISVKYQLADPEASKLFAKAILHSGGGVNLMDNPPIIPVGTRGEIIPKAVEDGAFDAKPIMMGFTADDPGFLGRPTVLEFGDIISSRGNGNVFIYDFERNLPGEAEGEFDFGSFHTAELWYTFGTLGRAWRPFTEADYELSRRMLDAWTGFARSSNPGWDAYNTQTKCVKVFDVEE